MEERQSSESTKSANEILLKPKAKSELWQYFGLRTDKNGKPVNDRQAVYKMCRQSVIARNGFPLL